MKEFRHNFITIEGNIGAGKTTLAEYLAEITGGQLLLERFEENPFLIDFYRNKEEFAYDTECFFLDDRIKQLKDFFTQRTGIAIADYSIYKSLVFSELNLSPDKMKAFQLRFNSALNQIKKPDLIIHLSNSIQEVKERIQKRGRSYESNIGENYLSNIENGYLKYWNSQSDLNVLIIDASKITFPYSKEEIIKLIDYLQKTEIKGLIRL